jgi:tRNA modification GTPase
VELEGVRRARERAADADLVLWVVDASAKALGTNERPVGAWLVRNKIDLLAQGLTKNESEITPSGINEPENLINKPLNDIVNVDLGRNNESRLQIKQPLTDMVNQLLTSKSEPQIIFNEMEFSLSVMSGVGFENLLGLLQLSAAQFLSGAEQSLVSRARHREVLEATLAALQRAEQLSGSEDLLAEELRSAAFALGRLTGRVDVEDVLDVIFRDFCIGK